MGITGNDLADSGIGAIGSAASSSGSPGGQAIGSTLSGAATGAAIGGGVATYGGLGTAGAVASAMGTSLAIGSSIPVPLLGTLIGAIAGAISAVILWFKNKPSPEFSRELLAVFRCYPNVLFEWVTERDALGIHTEHSDLRGRWGYISTMREQAGEKGHDIFEDEDWQKKFELGLVLPPPCTRQPNLKVLGIDPTLDEIKDAAAEIRVLLAGQPLVTSVMATSDGVVLSAKAIVPQEVLATVKWKPSRTFLYVYNGKVPVHFNALPPIAETKDAAVQLAANNINKLYQHTKWFEAAKVITTATGPALEVTVSNAPNHISAKSLAGLAGFPVKLVEDNTWLWLLGGAAALTIGGTYAMTRKP